MFIHHLLNGKLLAEGSELHQSKHVPGWRSSCIFLNGIFYVQIPEQELAECCGIVRDHLVAYGNQPSRQPRLQLSWTVSRRTLTKLKPSSRVEHNLEPIMEDEDMVDSASSDDAGPFDRFVFLLLHYFNSVSFVRCGLAVQLSGEILT